MLEMTIDSIRVSLMNYQRVVILRVKDSDRYLPIWIGASEADSIAIKLQDVDVPRPMTHDLLVSLIGSIGATIDHIIISELSNDTFFAKIILQINDELTEVDARPSDAIAIAVRAQVPIYAGDDVVERAGVQMDLETGKPVLNTEDKEQSRPLRDEELRSLSAFKDFVDTLDLEDLGSDSKRPEEPPTPTTGS